MTYSDAIRYLDSLARFGWRLGLTRMEALSERMGHPERSFSSIQVAGTNGKGSTSTFLAGILSASGIKTGLYTSPHLYSGRERIKVDGVCITEEETCSLLQILIPHIQKVSQHEGAVTEFEAWTTLAFMHFERCGVHSAVVESGLGGRWDSTNIVHPRLSILTNVALDHTDRLGNTIGEIARDKAGIIKNQSKALIGPLNQEARTEVVSEIRLTHARLFSLLSQKEASNTPSIPDETRYFWEEADYPDLVLTGPDGQRDLFSYSGPHYQARNAALAATAARILSNEDGYSISSKAILQGLSTVIPGRFEVLVLQPELIVDAAHNSAAAAVLAAELSHGQANFAANLTTAPDLRLVFGSSAGHDGESCLRILAPMAQEVILTRARNPRSRDPQELARVLEEIDVPYEVVPDVSAAVGTAIRRSRPFDRVCVTGSFFVVAEVPRVVMPV